MPGVAPQRAAAAVDGSPEALTPRSADIGGPVKLRIAYLKVGLAIVSLASFVVAVGAPSKFG